MSEQLIKVVRAGVLDASYQIGVADDDHSIVEQANEEAIAYARDRAAEMVGMKWVDGELVPNPNAEWQITESTREMLRATIRDAIESGESNDVLADRIADHYAFSDERAETIARTETRIADVQGNLALYRASGMVAEKQWVAFADCCDECQDLDGQIVGLDEDFTDDGGDGPPLHPNCRCTFVPVIQETKD